MRFFVLEEPGWKYGGGEPTEFLPEKPHLVGSAEHCPRCGSTISMLPHLPPIRVSLERWGTEFDDIVFGVGYQLLVSERFWILYRDAGLTGLISVAPAEVVKVKAHDRRRLTPPGYHCVRVAPGRAAVDDVASGMEGERRWTCEECRSWRIIKRMARLVLEDGTWAGEDFFRPRGLTGTIVTTERAKEFCDRHAFKNVLLIPSEDYHFDFYPWELRRRE